MAFTPPVSRDNFHYANGDLYVSSTARNQHRRAAIPELQALFHPPAGQPPTSDPPAHWYKAQLLHYGLPPSDNKGTAVKRLLDAVNTRTLEVPAHLRKLELELKKEWDANHRKATRDIGAAEKKGAAKGTKRKAEDALSLTPNNAGGVNVSGINFNFNINFGGASGSTIEAVLAPSSASAKKTKTTTTSRKTSEQSTRKDSKVKNETKSQTKVKPEHKLKPEPKTKKEPGVKKESTSKAVKTEPKSQTRVKAEPVVKRQVKREVKQEATLKMEPKMKHESVVKDEPIYNDYNLSQNEAAPFSSPSGPPLGLLNGRYDVDLEDGQSGYITLCLQGKSMWGDFNFSSIKGAFFMPQRPWRVSSSCDFEWGGEYWDDQQMRCNEDCTGAIKFLGDGQIEGYFGNITDWGDDSTFRGIRTSGSQTRSPRDASSMREELQHYRALCS